jgi:hypothetical protein
MSFRVHAWRNKPSQQDAKNIEYICNPASQSLATTHQTDDNVGTPERSDSEAAAAAAAGPNGPARFFLLHELGPTSFVIKQSNSKTKHRVMIGSEHKCSCHSNTSELCVHIYFVLLKVLRVPPDNPLCWQASLTDTDVSKVLQLRYTSVRNRRHKKAKHLSLSSTLRNQHNSVSKSRTLCRDEVCPICQEDLLPATQFKPDQDEVELREREITKLGLICCASGCGNAAHIKCMQVWSRHRRSVGEPLTCPLCRNPWSDQEVATMYKQGYEQTLREKRKQSHDSRTTSSAAATLSCSSCKQMIHRNEKQFRCVKCASPAATLCQACFDARKHSNSVPEDEQDYHRMVWRIVGQTRQHISGPGEWQPAIHRNESRRQREEIMHRILTEVQSREISTEDYEMLLMLDEKNNGTPVLHKYLVDSLETVTCAQLRAFPCVLCTASGLRLIGGQNAAVKQLPCGHIAHEQCLYEATLYNMYITCGNMSCAKTIFRGLVAPVQRSRRHKTIAASSELEAAATVSHRKSSSLSDDAKLLGLQICASGLSENQSQLRNTSMHASTPSSARKKPVSGAIGRHMRSLSSAAGSNHNRGRGRSYGPSGLDMLDIVGMSVNQPPATTIRSGAFSSRKLNRRGRPNKHGITPGAAGPGPTADPQVGVLPRQHNSKRYHRHRHYPISSSKSEDVSLVMHPSESKPSMQRSISIDLCPAAAVAAATRSSRHRQHATRVQVMNRLRQSFRATQLQHRKLTPSVIESPTNHSTTASGLTMLHVGHNIMP